MKAVGFLIGDPLSGPCWTSCPYWHWSPTTRSTPSCAKIFLTQSSCQDAAPAGCSCKKIPTGVDLILVYLHYKTEMHHCADVLPARDGGIPQLAVEGLPCAERLAGGASYYEDGILISKQRSCAHALVGSIKIPGLTVMRIDGGKIERYSWLE